MKKSRINRPAAGRNHPRIILRGLMALAALFALAVPAWADWNDTSAGEIQRLETMAGASASRALTGASSAMFGICPNFSQAANGRFMAVVSREFGRLARPGALIGWYYPHQADNRLQCSFQGIRLDDRLSWFDDLVFAGQELIADTGIIVTRFRDPDGLFEITCEDVAGRDADLLARRITFVNRGPFTVSPELLHFAFFQVSRKTLNDRLRWDQAEQSLVQTAEGEEVVMVTGADRRPTSWQCGQAGQPSGDGRDAGLAARDGRLPCSSEASSGPLGVNGAMTFTLGKIGPGEEARIELFIACGTDATGAAACLRSARDAGWKKYQSDDRQFWKEYLDACVMPAASPRERSVYRRAMIVLEQLQADTGAMLASSARFSPMYKYVWMQDLTVDVRAFCRNRRWAEARAALAFMSRVQKDDGDWWVTYHADGRPNMLWEHGSEWMGGHFLSALREYIESAGDRAFAEQVFPVVEKACAFLISRRHSCGMLENNKDLWETYSNRSWSYTNGSFVGGLESAARIARLLGREKTAEDWELAAAGLREAILKYAVVRRERYFGKGVDLKTLKADPVIDASVLGLTWPFAVVGPRHPSSLATSRRIEEKLLYGNGSIPRWPGDTWYGGQGWPELTDWMAYVLLLQQEKSKASALHDSITEKACTTRSLQIGEVYDERSGRFTSAFPLGWPEAQYVITSLALSGTQD